MVFDGTILDVAQRTVKYRVDVNFKKLNFEECNLILDVIRNCQNRLERNLVVEEKRDRITVT